MPNRLSVVIPVYNESAMIRTVLERVAAVPLVSEIIVVDDASTDGTREILHGLRKEFPFTLISHPVNQGKGACLHTAFRQVRGELTIVQDADLEYNPKDYPKLARLFESAGVDVVYGSRYLEKREIRSWHTLGNRLLTFLSNLVNRTHLTDMETCYKMFRTETLKSFPLRCLRFGFEPEVTARLAHRRARIAEVPIAYRPRGYAAGKKIGLWDAFKTVGAILICGLFR